MTVSAIPDRHTNINPASRAQFLASPGSRGTVKSRIPSIYLSFSRFPHRILIKSRIPKIPFQTLIKLWWTDKDDDDDDDDYIDEDDGNANDNAVDDDDDGFNDDNNFMMGSDDNDNFTMMIINYLKNLEWLFSV